MDIAKYIGLFLLKNKYVCLQGLGNLEILKKAAQQDGDTISGSAYYAKLNPVGSLDDAFPNFVATNEQVSIAKASNEISNFVKEAKAALAAGSHVVIPSVGEYVPHNGQIHFELNPAFSSPEKNIHFPKQQRPEAETSASKDTAEASYNHYNQRSNVNWNLVAFWAVIVIIGGSIVFWGIRYFMTQQNGSEYVEESASVSETIPQPDASSYTTIDSNSTPTADSITTNAPLVSDNDTPEIRFIIQQYNTLERANSRSNKLNSYGYVTSVISQDSSTHLVIQKMKVNWADTTHVKDSLSKLLNPSGVSILK